MLFFANGVSRYIGSLKISGGSLAMEDYGILNSEYLLTVGWLEKNPKLVFAQLKEYEIKRKLFADLGGTLG